MKKVQWFFDYISPYAYLQMCELDRFKKEIDIEPIPVLFAGLLDNAGQLGPAEIPKKREFTFRICLWYAKSRKIEMKLPKF